MTSKRMLTRKSFTQKPDQVDHQASSKKRPKPIRQENIERIIQEMDPQSRAITFYLWENRFATIDELASICGAPNHMDVLLKIEEIINPLSKKIIGAPLLAFERSKIDPETGKTVLFSWWLAEADKGDERGDSLVDLFDEGDYLRIVIELSGVDEESIQLKVHHRELILSAQSPEKRYMERVSLPASVIPDITHQRYKNGILEVRLKKSMKPPQP